MNSALGGDAQVVETPERIKKPFVLQACISRPLTDCRLEPDPLVAEESLPIVFSAGLGSFSMATRITEVHQETTDDQ